MSNNVWHYGCFSWFYFGWCYISYASAYDSWIDISLALKAFEHAYFISDTLLTYLYNAKAKLFIFRNSLAFIS